MVKSMQSIFMARGPSFKNNTRIDSLKNVDIYHIACYVLNITPNPYANASSLVNLTNIFAPIETTTPTTTSMNSACLCSIHTFLFLLTFFILSSTY